MCAWQSVSPSFLAADEPEGYASVNSAQHAGFQDPLMHEEVEQTSPGSSCERSEHANSSNPKRNVLSTCDSDAKPNEVKHIRLGRAPEHAHSAFRLLKGKAVSALATSTCVSRPVSHAAQRELQPLGGKQWPEQPRESSVCGAASFNRSLWK